MVPRVFSVPGLGCFQFPDSGLLFPEWCVGRPWVFSVPGMVFPVPGQRGRHGGVCGSRTVFLLASSCFSAFLCSLLPSLVLPFFFLFSLPVIFVSFPPFLPSPFPFSSCASFNLPSILPFLASCPCFLPIPFLSVSSPSRIPFPYLAFLSLMPFPVPSLPFPNSHLFRSLPFPSPRFASLLSLPFPSLPPRPYTTLYYHHHHQHQHQH